MRFKALNDGRLLDTLVGKKLNPRSANNREWAATLSKGGNTELSDILKRIDGSENLTQRMAGDAIPEGLDSLINDIREEGIDEVSANKQQLDYIGEQVGRFVHNDRMFERAGVPVDVAPTITDTVGRMSNGVPMPFVDKSSKQGVERRVHTRFEKNPYTDEFEIAPFVDVDTGGALVSEFGDSRVANIDNFTGQRGDKATEYVAERVLKLMGLAPRRGPFAGVDFQVDMGGKQVGIDAQIQRGDGPLQTQLYTYLRPQDKNYEVSKDGGFAVANDMRSMIRNAPNASTSNLVDVIESMADNGQLNDKHNNRFGKALKDDYDYAVMPQYDIAYANRNQKANDTITEAPNSIAFVDLKKALSDISQVSAKEAIKRDGQARVSWNMGNNKQGPMRARINIQTPDDAVRDAVASRPYAAQMLKELT